MFVWSDRLARHCHSIYKQVTHYVKDTATGSLVLIHHYCMHDITYCVSILHDRGYVYACIGATLIVFFL